MAVSTVPAGLSSAEAASRTSAFGPNAIPEEFVHPIRRIARHFWAPVPWMLEATVALQLAIGEHVEAVLVAALLLFNVALGVFQESRATAALDLLKQRLAPKARVRRDGKWADMPAADLVPGDIVQLSLGDIVPADLAIISGLVVLDQSMLTGESVPVEAGPDKAAYAGGLVRRGEAIAEVIATGPRTYFGHTAELVQTAHVESSEQQAVLGVVRALTVGEFCHRRRHGRLRARHRHGRAPYHSAGADRAAIRGARRAARDLHACVRPGREDARIAGRAVDQVVGAARGGDDRRAVRRQDRNADRERACRRRGASVDRRLRRGRCSGIRRGGQLGRRAGCDRRRDPFGCIAQVAERDAVHSVRSGHQDGRSGGGKRQWRAAGGRRERQRRSRLPRR